MFNKINKISNIVISLVNVFSGLVWLSILMFYRHIFDLKFKNYINKWRLVRVRK